MFMRGTTVNDAPSGTGYATDDKLQIDGGDAVTVTGTGLVLTDDVAVSGDGYFVNEQLTVKDQTDWAHLPVIEVSGVDDAGEVTDLEMRKPGLYTGSFATALEFVTTNDMINHTGVAGSYATVVPETMMEDGSYAGHVVDHLGTDQSVAEHFTAHVVHEEYDVEEIAAEADGADAHATQEIELKAKQQYVLQEAKQQQHTSPVLAAAVACGLAIVAVVALVGRKRITTSAAQQGEVASTPAASASSV